jgi:hypothetical protein
MSSTTKTSEENSQTQDTEIFPISKARLFELVKPYEIINIFLRKFKKDSDILTGDIIEHPKLGNIRISREGESKEDIFATFEKHDVKCNAIETIQYLFGISPEQAVQKIIEDMQISLKPAREAIIYDRNPDGTIVPKNGNVIHKNQAEKAENKHIEAKSFSRKGTTNKSNNQKGYNDTAFPVEAFPHSIQEVILELRDKLNFPVDYMGSAILFAATVAIGNSVKVRIKEGWIEQATLFIALVGRPGSNKSHPLEFAIKPLQEKDNISYQNYEFQLREYQKLSGEDQKEAVKPVFKQTLLNDFTLEALYQVHSINPKGIGVYKDEFSGWLKDMNRYRAGSDVEFWLSCFSGKSITVNRKSADTLHIPRLKISVIGSIQPGILANAFDSQKQSNGFLDRVLFAYPEATTCNKWNEKEIEPELEEFYGSVINDLLKRTSSKEIGFNPGAKDMWQSFYNELHELIADDSTSESTKGLLAKMDIYFARIALTLQMLYWSCGEGTDREIHEDPMAGALKLVDYYSDTAIRVREFIRNGSNTLIDYSEIAKEMHDEGYSYREIAKVFNVSKTTIGNWAKKYRWVDSKPKEDSS